MKQNNKKRYIILSVIGVVALALLIWCMSHVIGSRPKKVDMQSADGCYEFYKVKWGMSLEDLDKTVKIKHAMSSDNDPTDGKLEDDFFSVLEPFNLYGHQADSVYCTFKGSKLNSVKMIFSKSNVSMEQLHDLMVRIYGPTLEQNTWIGDYTKIRLIDIQEKDQSEKNIMLWYSEEDGSQYTFLNGSSTNALDPLDLLNPETTLFGQPCAPLTEGLVDQRDYTWDAIKGEYKNYTFYPQFEYLGVPAGETAVELLEKQNGICKISYRFLLQTHNRDERDDVINTAISELETAYGDPIGCTYTELFFSDPDVETIQPQEFVNRMYSNIEGIYNMTWAADDGIDITLRIFNDKSSEYVNAYVIFHNPAFD